MNVSILLCCALVSSLNGMEYFSHFYEEQREEHVKEDILSRFGIPSRAAIDESAKKLRDDQGNTLLHALVLCASPDVDLLQSLIVDNSWSVREKNMYNEDPWIYGLRVHKSNPNFFLIFDLLYHGPTKLQWNALCGSTSAVYDALEREPHCFLEVDQRGYPLIYYAWRNTTLLKELIKKGAFASSNPDMYKKIVSLWLFRAQQEAKCGRSKEHKKMVEAARIAFGVSDALFSCYGEQFFYRAIYVDSGLVALILKKLRLSTKNMEECIQKGINRVQKRYNFLDDTYYSGVLSLIYKYLADA